MVLEDLDGADVLVADAIGGHAVLAAEQVRALDVELVDVLALVRDLAALGDVDTGHALQHVANGAVGLLGETADVVCDGVALLADAVGLDSHLPQLDGARLHQHRQGERHRVERERLAAVAHQRDLQAAAGHVRHRQREAPLGVAGAEFLDLVVGTLDDHRSARERCPVGAVEHHTPHSHLRRQGQQTAEHIQK